MLYLDNRRVRRKELTVAKCSQSKQCSAFEHFIALALYKCIITKIIIIAIKPLVSDYPKFQAYIYVVA